MIRKRQASIIPANDMPAQTIVLATLFGAAA